MKIKYIIPVPFLLIQFLFWSCSSGNSKAHNELSSDDTSSVQIAEDADLPSPMEMAILVKESGAKYNPLLTNNLKNLTKYLTNPAKALNLGVYCSDVGYITLFKQTQETMFYLSNCRKLSDDIGLTTAFDKSVFDRVEENIDRRDSLLGLITESYAIANKYLKENNRYGTFMLMMAGGWIESMHLACNMALEKGAGNEIAAKISEQKIPLKKIIKSMQPYKSEPEIEQIQATLTKILSTLETGEFTSQKNDKTEINQALLNNFANEIEKARNEITRN
jgi:hypothetical protein